MKLIKKLYIENKEYRIISDNIELEQSAPGRAVIVVESSTLLAGIVKYHCGYDNEYQLYMTGYIESSTRIDCKQQRLFIREFAAVMNRQYYLSCRHVTIEDVILKFAEQSGLEFIIEESSWNNTIMPHFINHGSGYLLLNTLGRELEIENFCWYSQPNGKIWIGNCKNSRYGKQTLNIPAEITTQTSISGTTIPVIPQYRPGLKICVGKGRETQITKITLTEAHMRLTFKEPV